jgi:sugar O-acyltransferase (sialic acid O-acetyltransferase NeuD family)
MHCHNNIIILGASGHAKVVASTARSLGKNIFSFYDDKIELKNSKFFDSRILGTIEDAMSIDNSKYVIAIGKNSVRKSINDKYKNACWLKLVSAFSYVDSSVSINNGSIVAAGAVIQPDVKIGIHCIINTKASVDHDCQIGDFVHISVGVTLCGDVTVGSCSQIGAGTVVKPGIKIGNNVMIGAGSTVVSDIPSNNMAYGTPAKIIKKGLFI